MIQKKSFNNFLRFRTIYLACVLIVCVYPYHAHAAYTYQNQFGISGAGTLSGPVAAAVDSSNNIYVSDSNNGRIVKFNSSGVYQSQIFGNYGSGDGQFSNPFGVAVASSGIIYIADNYNNRVEAFNSDGSFKFKFGTLGSGNTNFNNPIEVAVASSSGNIYVLDQGNDRIVKFNASGTYQLQIDGNVGSSSAQFASPVGIALDPTENIYIGDANTGIKVYNSSGTFLFNFGTGGTTPGTFTNPYGIAIAPSGNIYVASLNDNNIQVFNSAGVYQSQFGDRYGAPGSGNGDLHNPYGVTVDSLGNIYAVDTSNNRIEVFSPPATSTNSVVTSTSTTVATSSVVLSGLITDIGYGNATQSGFIYSSLSPTLSSGVSTTTLGAQVGTTTFSGTVSGLTPNTTYYFSAYATNPWGTGYGAIISTTTLPAYPPTVTTSPVSSITVNSAVLNGAIVSGGYSSSTVEGFNYGTTAGYGSVASTTGVFGIGSFTQSINGLSCSTTYHVQAFAINSIGIGTSTDLSFTTSNCPSPVVTTQTPVYASAIGGSVSVSDLKNLLAPSAAATAYLNSLASADEPIASSTITTPIMTVQATSTSVPPISRTLPATMVLPNANTFSRTLSVGSSGADVRELQVYLNTHGYIIAAKGPGSPGHETVLFGNSTKMALEKFQKNHGIRVTGELGPITRAAI